MRDRLGAGTALSVRAQLGTERHSARERHAARRAAESVSINKLPHTQVQSSVREQCSVLPHITLERRNENLRKEAGHKGKLRYLERKPVHEAKGKSISK
jgi:hypothetical protein